MSIIGNILYIKEAVIVFVSGIFGDISKEKIYDSIKTVVNVLNFTR